ncbi:hypothetical protein [Streptomyces mangrovisoli]|uniref:Uncharacterized protein n=1 Tax=Streptomyces mangrovisoli TaxID=1428628 RepID=A0A1J4NNV4_9ACTN|nr:hypothetical protein [Streptomyces mangrovisoli]OIJ62854.1 hypothetical protein WN71_037245 [Streptomyces mangrovisoli]
MTDGGRPEAYGGAPPDAVPETFAFRCRDCGNAWEATFRVVFVTDPTADPAGPGPGPQEYVDEAGRAMRTPLSDAVCARCGSRRVRVAAPDA